MKFPSSNGQVEDNVSVHIKISIDVELNPRPPINQGAKPIEKLENLSLTDNEHCTQIGERMQGQPFDMSEIDPKVICH
ncbi:hypothetical protein CR513_00719, partial [Mucuna pruriens]